mgnify:FL=1
MGSEMCIRDRPDVDGFLVGGASLDAEELSNIVRLTAAQSRL